MWNRDLMPSSCEGEQRTVTCTRARFSALSLLLSSLYLPERKRVFLCEWMNERHYQRDSCSVHSFCQDNWAGTCVGDGRLCCKSMRNKRTRFATRIPFPSTPTFIRRLLLDCNILKRPCMHSYGCVPSCYNIRPLCAFDAAHKGVCKDNILIKGVQFR